MSSGGSGGQGGAPDCGAMLKNWWANLPLFCKGLFYLVLGFYAISWLGSISFIFSAPLYYSALSPFMIFKQYQVWRLLTAPLCNPQLIMLLFGLMSYMPRAGEHERMEGTTRMAMEFIIYTLVISVLFCLLGLTLSGMSPGFFFEPLMGLWPLVMCEMVIDCNRDPDVSRNLCCLPIQIKSKYFPWVFMVIFFLLAPGASLSLVAGFTVGYAHIYGYLERIRPSEAKVRSWEKKFPFSKYSSHDNFITGSGQSQDMPTFVRNAAPGAASESTEASQQNFNAFGGSGVRLGDANASSGSNQGRGMGIAAMDRIRQLGGSSASTASSQADGPKGGELTRNSKLLQGKLNPDNINERNEEGHEVDGDQNLPYQQVEGSNNSTEELDEEASLDIDLKK